VAEDCAPDDAAIHPGAHEFCDGADDDCDGVIDETFDLDGDGWLADEADCRALGVTTDCDDTDAAVHPEASERCDGRDEDCNGLVDDDADDDGDGAYACTDCDDADPFVLPGAVEACNGVDDDCSGGADEPWDDDGDGTSECGGDCDDDDPTRSPNLPETCDGVDDDCDGEVDEGFDADGDGVRTCRGDCDDADAAVYAGATEICNGRDDDCDETTSEDGDLDGDGYTLCDGDCDDDSAAAYPGGTEVCDGVDNDCDGATDDQLECYSCVDATPYLVCLGYTDWESADEACTSFGAGLVVIDSAEENAAVATLAATYSGSGTWIGYTDAETEGTFLWVDGSNAGFTSWYSGEPNNSGNEDCAGTNFGALGYWNDYGCSSLLPFVCE
jgi:hypothetical protein